MKEAGFIRQQSAGKPALFSLNRMPLEQDRTAVIMEAIVFFFAATSYFC